MLLLAELEKYPDIINFDDVEVGLLMYVDDEGDNIGLYYLCNTKEEEVFYLNDVDESFFCETENTPIVSRHHLSKFYDSLPQVERKLRRLTLEQVQGLRRHIGNTCSCFLTVVVSREENLKDYLMKLAFIFLVSVQAKCVEHVSCS